MTNKQVAAARRVMRGYSALWVTMVQNGSSSTVTPYKSAAPHETGTPVIVNSETPVGDFENDLAKSCAALMATVSGSSPGDGSGPGRGSGGGSARGNGGGFMGL